MMYNVYVSEHPCYPLSIETIKTITITTGSTPKVSEALSECKLCRIGFIFVYVVLFVYMVYFSVFMYMDSI